MKCTKCNRDLSNSERVAAISGSITGDECTDVYYFCPVCQVYSIATWWDNFTGTETSAVSGPLSRKEGDERIDLIHKCTEPWNKKCRCESHLRYFNNQLD